jgi:hypothetical protein
LASYSFYVNSVNTQILNIMRVIRQIRGNINCISYKNS